VSVFAVYNNAEAERVLLASGPASVVPEGCLFMLVMKFID